jgi:hypothetical protein
MNLAFEIFLSEGDHNHSLSENIEKCFIDLDLRLSRTGTENIFSLFYEKSHLNAPPGRAGMKNACGRKQHRSGRVVAWPSDEPATVCTTPAIIWYGRPRIGNGCGKERFGSGSGNCFARLQGIMDLRLRNWRWTRIMSIYFSVFRRSTRSARWWGC